jgi:hypothetical protein
MARISYDDETAAAFKAVRELPRDGLWAWRDAVRHHLSPRPEMTLVDIGAPSGVRASPDRRGRSTSSWCGPRLLFG